MVLPGGGLKTMSPRVVGVCQQQRSNVAVVKIHHSTRYGGTRCWSRITSVKEGVVVGKQQQQQRKQNQRRGAVVCGAGNMWWWWGGGGKGGKGARLEEKKDELLQSLSGLSRGVKADEGDKAKVERLAAQLEKMNPTKNVLGPRLTGRWKLLYTTSESILGSTRPVFLRPFGDIYQILDAEKLKARNQETLPFFNAVDAELVPEVGRRDTVKVQFTTFYIGGVIPVKAPPSAQGELKVTYLDDTLRISRGNRGNLFILSR